jgi:hypothetical protein
MMLRGCWDAARKLRRVKLLAAAPTTVGPRCQGADVDDVGRGSDMGNWGFKS